MDKIFRRYYRSVYMNTGGFFPSAPLNRRIMPGDFFQVKNGEMVVLGNIFRNSIIATADAEFVTGNRLNPSGWHFGDGLIKAYSGRGTGEGAMGDDFQYSRQVLAFNDAGSFYFHGHDPRSVQIKNWSQVAQSLIIKLTQTMYSFREVYVVTETATHSCFTLAVACSKDAELEMATEAESFGLVDIFGHPESKTIQSKDIEYFHRQLTPKPLFCKAKKLTVRESNTGAFVHRLMPQPIYAAGPENAYPYAEPGYEPDEFPMMSPYAQESVLEMLQANELNPNTALQYFTWTDASLDDVEKLFLTYGNTR